MENLFLILDDKRREICDCLHAAYRRCLEFNTDEYVSITPEGVVHFGLPDSDDHEIRHFWSHSETLSDIWGGISSEPADDDTIIDYLVDSLDVHGIYDYAVQRITDYTLLTLQGFLWYMDFYKSAEPDDFILCVAADNAGLNIDDYHNERYSNGFELNRFIEDCRKACP